ncbi:uncharacterized protein LOC110761039 [Prunus avium]|uniref:Uncharacterized protein LOC110761039 n=1 Tax=Prunus avium TaxID=42229 RepID=A0A6P5SZI3_PRUAV|nr:uncharacterized protein LOC110761039 [Prunus avium]
MEAFAYIPPSSKGSGRKRSIPFTSNSTDSWIWANTIDDLVNTASFWPEKVDDVVVTLRNLGSGNICKRLDDYLNAGPCEVPPQWTHLEVEEHVKSRTISILNFHALTDAKIYNRIIDMEVAIGYAENRNQQPASKTIWLAYEDTKASTWNTSTEDLDFTAIIPTLTSDTPFILDEERIDISGNFNGTYQWGPPHISSTPIRLGVRVVVPALSCVTVRLLATHASCDIPFNYSKNDTPLRTTYNEEVGLYTGVSLYNFHQVREEAPLPPAAG